MIRLKLNILITLLAILISIRTNAQEVGVSSVTVRFVGPPGTYNVKKAPLKYNKDFAFGMHLDDGNKDIYTHAFPFLNGGTVEGTTYPGLFYTDGCGNDIAFKMSSSIFSFAQDTIDCHDPEGPYSEIKVTWPELNELYKNNWGVYNHGLVSDISIDPYYTVRRNHSYVKRMMQSATPGGPEMKVFVNPNGAEKFTTPAFNEDYIVAYRQYSFGVPSFDVTADTIGDTIKMGRTSLEAGVSLSDIVDDIAAASVNGAHHFGSTFSHSVTGGFGYSFPVFRAHMNYIEDTYGKDGQDNVWMATEEEILEYLMNSEDITIDTQLIYTDLIITFDGTLRTDFKYYALSLVVDADQNIDTIFIDGGTSYSFNGLGNDTALINLEWDGYVRVADTVNAEKYVGIAEQTEQQPDWNIAMDYVEMIAPGPTKEEFRDRLCAIPGIQYPSGYCFCTTHAGPDTTLCEGECVTLTAEKGDIYIWSTGDSTQSIYVCPDSTTDYYVTVFNDVGCPATDTVTVTIVPLPEADAGNDTTVCSGDCATLTATGGIEYFWSTGDTTQSIETCPLDTTEYFVTVTNVYGCSSDDSVTVNVIESPVANAGDDTTICYGDCAMLTASGGISYYWNTGDTNQSILVCPLDSSVYYVTVYSANGCDDTDSVNVYVNPLPQPDAGNDTSICQGDTAILTATGGISYYWSTGDTTPTIKVSPPDTTEYFVTVTNQYGCSATDSVMVYIFPTPNPLINSGTDTTICDGDCAVLSIDTGNNILWNTGDTVASITVCPDTDSMYYVTVTNEYNCSGSDTIMVYVQPLPDADAGSDQMICLGDCVTLTASGGTSYIWDHGDSTATTIVCPEETTYYYVTVFDDLGCSARDSVEVIVRPVPEITLTPDTGVCIDGCITLVASGGTSYLWSTGDTTSEITVCPEMNTRYYVEAFNEYNCSARDSVSVFIFPDPEPKLPDDTVICDNECITLTCQEGTEFLWSTGDTTKSIDVCPNEQTKYLVSVVDEHGCKGNDSITIGVKPATDNYIYNLLPAFCENEDSVRLYGYPGGGYFSGPGVIPYQDDYYFFPDSAGTGKVPVVYVYLNELGCTSYDTAFVSIYPMPELNIGKDTTVCNNKLYTLDAGPDYDFYLWFDGSIEQAVTFYPGKYGTGEKMFDVIVTKDGCTGYDDITLNIIICNPGINDLDKEPDICISPNPVTEKLFISINNNQNDIKLEIINIKGEIALSGIIKKCKYKNCTKIFDVTRLQKGLYIVRLFSDEFIKVKKLIVN